MNQHLFRREILGPNQSARCLKGLDIGLIGFGIPSWVLHNGHTPKHGQEVGKETRPYRDQRDPDYLERFVMLRVFTFNCLHSDEGLSRLKTPWLKTRGPETTHMQTNANPSREVLVNTAGVRFWPITPKSPGRNCRKWLTHTNLPILPYQTTARLSA